MTFWWFCDFDGLKKKTRLPLAKRASISRELAYLIPFELYYACEWLTTERTMSGQFLNGIVHFGPRFLEGEGRQVKRTMD